MLTLYIGPDCGECRRLAQRLDEAHLAHRTRRAEPGAGREPHTLIDGDETVEGHRAIDERIDAVADMLRRARRYQSDVCMDFGDEPPEGQHD